MRFAILSMMAMALAATEHGQARRGDTIRITIERVGAEAAPIVLTDWRLRTGFVLAVGPDFPATARWDAIDKYQPKPDRRMKRRVSAPANALPIYKVSFGTEGFPGTYVLLYAMNQPRKKVTSTFRAKATRSTRRIPGWSSATWRVTGSARGAPGKRSQIRSLKRHAPSGSCLTSEVARWLPTSPRPAPRRSFAPVLVLQ
jgi:hypothetical protein